MQRRRRAGGRRGRVMKRVGEGESGRGRAMERVEEEE